MTATPDTPRLAAEGDRITRQGMRTAHVVRRVREGVTESGKGREARPYADMRCGIRMWATLADGPTDVLGVSWLAPDDMLTCQACSIGARASRSVRAKTDAGTGVAE